MPRPRLNGGWISAFKKMPPSSRGSAELGRFVRIQVIAHAVNFALNAEGSTD
jgi:hypothetical protein